MYLLDLLLHGFDVIFSRFDLLLQLLDFVVQHELELFEFLVFLLEIVNSLFLKKAKQNRSQNDSNFFGPNFEKKSLGWKPFKRVVIRFVICNL